MWGGVFDDKSTISAIQGFKFKNNYEIRNLREILHNICANVKMLHGHFKLDICALQIVIRKLGT